MKEKFDLTEDGKGSDFPMNCTRVYPDLLTSVLYSLLLCRNNVKYA